MPKKALDKIQTHYQERKLQQDKDISSKTIANIILTIFTQTLQQIKNKRLSTFNTPLKNHTGSLSAIKQKKEINAYRLQRKK